MGTPLRSSETGAGREPGCIASSAKRDRDDSANFSGRPGCYQQAKLHSAPEVSPEKNPSCGQVEWRALLDSNQWPSASESRPDDFSAPVIPIFRPLSDPNGSEWPRKEGTGRNAARICEGMARVAGVEPAAPSF